MAQPRRVVVLGGGIVGVTSAYHLAQNGCAVTLVERRSGAGLETSFANGGLITPSMSDPWAAPGIPRLLLSWLGREDSPFLVRPGAVPSLASWGLKFIGQCNGKAWRRNTATILCLSRYSHRCLKDLVRDSGLAYDANASGTLHLFRDRLSMDKTKETAAYLGTLGVPYSLLDAPACIELEPALASQAAQISGGIHYPEDEAGDAHLFTQRLAELCAAKGVDFRYGETVQRIERHKGAVTAVITDRGRLETEACLVALGNESAALVRPLGVKLPIYPVKGYSVTFPIEGWNGAPRVPFVDDGCKIGVVRIGERVRVAGTAEFAGYDKTLNPKRVANLKRFFLDLFPAYPDPDRGQAWTGLRPMTPDGIPYLGSTPVAGLYLNTGQGHLGWTMSCGSAKAVSDVILGQEPEIDLTGMALSGR